MKKPQSAISSILKTLYLQNYSFISDCDKSTDSGNSILYLYRLSVKGSKSKLEPIPANFGEIKIAIIKKNGIDEQINMHQWSVSQLVLLSELLLQKINQNIHTGRSENPTVLLYIVF